MTPKRKPNCEEQKLAFTQVDQLVPASGSHETAQRADAHPIGPDGRPLTLADLPSPDTKRWVIRRKAEVVAAVRGGLLSLEEACSRYALNFEEFQSWQDSIDRFGFAGLRTTRTQMYRKRGTGPERLRLYRKERWKRVRVWVWVPHSQGHPEVVSRGT